MESETARRYKSAFTATSPSSIYTSGNVKFSNVLSNIGSDYSSSTGIFTCQYPGIYMFTAHLYKYPSTSYDYAVCRIQLNGSDKIIIYIDPYDPGDGRYYSGSNSIILRLKYRDRVTLGDCSSSTGLYTASSFSGFLVKPD